MTLGAPHFRVTTSVPIAPVEPLGPIAQFDTLIINGQSNAAASPPQKHGWSALLQFLGADLEGFFDTANAFAPLVDGSASSIANAVGGGTGTGPGAGYIGALLMRRLADANAKTTRCYSLAFSGQAIAYFLPTSVTAAFFEDGSQTATGLNNYDLLEAYVAAAGIVPKLYVWCQGEADAGRTQADYYASLRTLFDATRVSYPGIKWLIIPTIGDAQDRIGTAVATGVRAAQNQLADEEPGIVAVVPNLDLRGSTAYYRQPHYSAYVGWEEIGERCFVTLQGAEPRPDVEQGVPHLQDGWVPTEPPGGVPIVSWDQYMIYTRSITAGEVVVWQGQTLSLSPNTTAPQQISNDSRFASRSTVDFVAANLETMKLTGLAAADTWTFFGVFFLDLLIASKFAFLITRADNSQRAALVSVGGSNVPSQFYGGAAGAFSPLPPSSDVVRPHSWAWVLDTPNRVGRLYIDGVFIGKRNIDGSQTAMTDIWIASLLATSIQDGPWAAFAYKRNLVPTDEQVSNWHAWARVEFGLEGDTWVALAAFGDLRFEDDATVLTVAGITIITAWTDTGPALRTTPSATTDNITIGKTGVFAVSAQLTFVGELLTTYNMYVYVNGVLSQLAAGVEPSLLEPVSMSLDGLLFLTAGDVVDLRITGDSDITLIHGQLAVAKQDFS